MEFVLELLAKHGIRAEKDGYVTLPQEHCFAAWRIAHRKAQGADSYALYWDVTYELRLCYRDGKTADDLEREKILEKEFRELEDLESDYTYDANDKLDITVYTFAGTTEF